MKRKHSKSAIRPIDILVAAGLLGLLGAISIPAFQRTFESNRHMQFSRDMETFANAVESVIEKDPALHTILNEEALAEELAEDLKSIQWENEPAIGGHYAIKIEQQGEAYVPVIEVANYSVTLAELTRFDTRYDDGDLQQGHYQMETEGRYAYRIRK